ncbi:MAG: peptide deformylase [bacterium]|nr:peptide deformylase [bacterium]
MIRPFDDTTAKHKVVIYGHPALRKRANEITVFDDALRGMAREMFATMTDYEGIGLAAPQIDKNIRLLVVGVIDEEKEDILYLAVCNPAIVDSSGSYDMEEGCLSIPDIRDTVTRPAEITLEYDTLEGERRKIKADGMLARVLQHEIDHLNGVLFIDHLSPIRRGLLSGKLKRLEREQQES